MIKTLAALRHLDFGFNPRKALTLRVPLFGPRYQDPQRRVEFFRELLARIEGLPGVRSASVSRGLPIHGWSGQNFVTEKNPNPPAGEVPAANYVVISPDYFQTMEIPLRRGRSFTEADTQASQRVVIVSEKLAHERWPGQDAIGKRLRMGGGEIKEPWLSVVGIAGSVLSQGPASGFHEEVYVPYTLAFPADDRLVGIPGTGYSIPDFVKQARCVRELSSLSPELLFVPQCNHRIDSRRTSFPK
jgi:putative ABC transport system permease protein